MASKRVCGKCGAELTDLGAEQLCPGCLLETGLDSIPDSSELLSVDAAGQSPIETSFPRAFGDYELLEEIAHGGMGIVYKARQVSLDRIVAVKMLLFGPLASPEFVQRFRTEAAAAASLQHPNIVAIHEVGFRQGQHFFAMDYVAGRSLADIVQDRPLPARRAAGYVKTIAEAIQYAHERGILHRDLKPSNVLIDEFDQPRVTDFGLAKRLEKETELTLSGQVLGSPNYMAPEQAAARRGQVGKGSDIYSLGGILYHLLTGRAPFVADTVAKTLHQVQNNEPVSPQLLNPSVPRDLTTICLKCLEKEPEKRYATAQALADELDRFLSRKPILARPVGRPEKLWRWCRRNPVIAILLATTLVLLLAVVIGSPIAVFQINKHRWQAEQRARDLRLNLYVANMNLAYQACQDGDLVRAQALLNVHRPGPHQDDLRGFEWRYLWKLCQDESEYTFTNITGGVRGVGFSGDGKTLVVTDAAKVRQLDPTTGREWVLLEDPRGIRNIAFPSKAANLVAIATEDNVLNVWDLATHQLRATYDPSGPRLQDHLPHPLAFSSDGKLLASVSGQPTEGYNVKVWDLDSESPAPKHTFAKIPDPVLGLAFTPDDRHLAACGAFRVLRTWDVASGTPLSPDLGGHTHWVYALAFSPDGRTLLSGGIDSSARVWDFAARRFQFRLLGHNGSVRAAVFSPDGQRLATGGTDRTIRIWDIGQRRQVAILRGHRRVVNLLALSSDGRWLVSGSTDNTVKLWDLTPREEKDTLKGHNQWVDGVVFSPDGKTLASVDHHEFLVKLWDVPSRKWIADLGGHTSPTLAIAFSLDGRLAATGGEDHMVILWNIEDPVTPKRIHSWTNAYSHSLAFSPDGRILAAAGWALRLWDLVSHQATRPLAGDTTGPVSLTFSPDGQLLATGYPDGRVALWDFARRQLLASFQQANSTVLDVAFSPNGAFLASGQDDGSVRLFDVAKRRACEPLGGHTSRVEAIAFATDGRTLATASRDTSLKLWNVATGQLALTLKTGHVGPVTGVAFSANGTLLATCGADGQVRLWPAATFEEVEASPRESKHNATGTPKHDTLSRGKERAASDLP
jgi:WD40 repeat protein/serine/threonine protein kinase